MRFTQIVATHLFLIRDNKILLSRRFNTGYEDGNFSLPAGHVEENETAVKALIRETKEEINVNIESKNLNFSHIMHRKSDGEHRVDFFFTCKKWTGDIKNNEMEKCDLIEWHDINNLPKNLVPYVKQAIKKMNQKVFYSEFGF